MSKARVLVVDDDAQMRDMLELGLQQEFEVLCVADGFAALETLRAGWRPDVVVLDIAMPKIDGVSLVPMLRRVSEAPVLMLSARNETPDKIAALTAGADDYVSKPFDLGELTARLRSRVRRPQLARPQALSFADVEMDLDARTVSRAGVGVELTAREFDLLATLLREPGRVFTRAQLIDRVWGDGAAVEPNVVETYVSYLRAKLERPPATRLIRTVRRVGYTLRA
jgi:DNA-binding response OmpR family regulator